MARNRGIFARRPLLEPAAVRAGIRESRRFASPRARALSDIAGPRVSRVPAVAAICSRLVVGAVSVFASGSGVPSMVPSRAVRCPKRLKDPRPVSACRSARPTRARVYMNYPLGIPMMC